MGTREILARGAALALILCLPWPRASAEEGGEKIEIASVEIEALLDLSVEAVTLKEERASLAPASVFVLSGDDLRRQGFRTLWEALRTVPGLFGYADGLYPLVGVRGLGTLQDLTTRLLVLVDGHPLNNSLGIGESYVGRDLPIPLAAVRRLEVIKGPVGSVYGPNAYLGVLNLVTTGGPAEAEVSAHGEGAQRAVRGGGAAAVASGEGAGVSWFASAEGYGSRGLDWSFPELAAQTDRPVPAGGRITGMDRARAFQGYARVGWRGLTGSAACGDFRRGLPSAPWLSTIGDPRNALENMTCFAQLAFSHALSSSLSLDARVSYDHFRYWDDLAYPPPPASFGFFKDYGRDSWISGDLRLGWRPFSSTRLVTGATVEAHDTVQHSYVPGLRSVIDDPEGGIGVGPIAKDYRTLNAYLLAEQALGSSVTLHGALTLYEHQLFGHRFTPKVAVVWQPTASDVLKALWSDGFRAPTAAEAFFEDGTSYLPNPKLRPETVRSFELAYERRLGGIASVTLSAFQNHYGDLIHFETIPAPGVVDPAPDDYRQISVNGGSLRLRGLELAATVRWREYVQAWGGFNLQEVDEPSRPNFPSWTANFAVSTRALWRPLTLSVNGAACGRRAKDPTVPGAGAGTSVDPALLLNLFASLEVPRAAGLSLELGVQNLLDAAALDPVPGDFAPISAMAQPARTFRAGLRYRF